MSPFAGLIYKLTFFFFFGNSKGYSFVFKPAFVKVIVADVLVIAESLFIRFEIKKLNKMALKNTCSIKKAGKILDGYIYLHFVYWSGSNLLVDF